MRQMTGYLHGINLGGWFSQCPHTVAHYDTFLSEQDFAALAELGAGKIDHIRLPIDYELLEAEDGTPINSGFDYLFRILEWCDRYHFHLLLDLHKTSGFSFDEGEHESGFFASEALQERFYRLWERIAEKFHPYADRVAFELLNEISDPACSDAWNRIAATCIQRVRAIAPDNWIVVGGYYKNCILALPDLLMPVDARMVYTFHFYEPLLFTHQGASWLTGMPESFRMPFPCSAADYTMYKKQFHIDALDFRPEDGYPIIDEKVVDAMVAKAVSLAEERNVPLYCGEYGVIQFADDASTLAWYRAFHAVLTRYQIGRAAWTFRSMHFGLTDPARTAIVSDLFSLL